MRYLLSFFVLLSTICSSQSMKLGVVGMGGYTFRSTYYGDYAQIVFKEGPSYGGVITLSPNEAIEIGFNFLQQDSKGTQRNYYPGIGEPAEIRDVPVTLSVYELSIIKNLILRKTSFLVPYAGIDLGVMNFRTKNGSNSAVKACWGIKAGLKFNLTESVSLRTQAQLQMPIAGIGLGVGVGTGGASVGAVGYSSMIQFAFIGGLGYTFGAKKSNSKTATP